MNHIRNILVLLFLFFIKPMLLAQTCECTVLDVQNNTVTSCELIVGDIINVATTAELKNAINQANAVGGNKTILIADGTYQIASPTWYPYITASNVVFRSVSGNRDNVILTGTGMASVAPNTENGIYCVGNNITIADLTIRDVGNHGIATHGDNLFVHNVKIQNTFEQMIKGTSAGDGSDNSIVQCSLFEYPQGVGPQYYIGGLDIHEGDNWIVRDNIFKNIASPSQSLAEHAIHFWDFSSNNTVERNWIINCDRGIGFGLGSSPNDGGIIRNNMIYNNGSGLFDDVGIGLETSPNTKVYNNTIYINYQNAIEYRFTETNNVNITNNLTNRPITSRNGGQAVLTTNNSNAQNNWFENLALGDLRLIAETPTVTNQGTSLPPDVTMDIDKITRPQGSGYDIGASEYAAPFLLNLNVCLEGVHIASGNMNSNLQQLNLLPPGQAYNIPPWNYEGTEGAGWTASDYPPNTVDWVLVSFRTSINKQDEIAQAAGLLQTDGNIIFLNENILPSGFNTPVYVVLEHRNHIGVMTSQPLNVINNALTYDFTATDTYAVGGGVGQKELSAGLWCMLTGDIDPMDIGSYDINGSDKAIWLDYNGLFNAYFAADLNQDGDVNGGDNALWNLNNGVFSSVPR